MRAQPTRRAILPTTLFVLVLALAVSFASSASAVVSSGPLSDGAEFAPFSPFENSDLNPSLASPGNRPALDDRSDIVPGRYIVVFEDSVKHPAALARAQTEGRKRRLGFVYRHAIEGYSAALPKSAVEALRRNPQVKRVSPVREVSVAAQPTPTGIKRIYATQNEVADIDEEDDVRVDVDVAVIDTGIDYDHADLNVAGRTDCVPAGEDTGEAVEAFEECIDGAGDDLHGHGSHVAGTIGALDNDKGVVGVAPGARLWAVRVLNKGGSGGTDWIIGGIDWVTATREDEDPENDIEVANVSIGCGLSCEAPDLDEAFSNSAEAGVVYAVAAGNDSGDASETTFANNPDTITVSALADYDGGPEGTSTPTCNDYGFDDTLATFSNYGEDVEVAAPGVCIKSTYMNGGYATISGTSMAAPHVAGAAALRASQDPPENLEDVEAIRAEIEADGNLEWTDESGDGEQEPLLDVGRAVTEPVTVDSASEVTLRGRVRPVGAEASYRFEYGETTEYGTSVPVPDAGIEPGSGYVDVSEEIGGLEGQTTYHYRVLATNAEEETVYGPDRAFGTTPPVATTEEASEVHANDATLNATVNPEGLPTDYYFEFGLSTDYGRRVPVAWEDAGSGTEGMAANAVAGVLNASTTYHYRVVARSGAGLVYGEDETFETAPPQWPGERVEQPNPNPLPSPTYGENFRHYLLGVSCATQDSCVAVGNFTSYLYQTEAMHWDGENWSAQPMAVPENGGEILATDVSCSSEDWCVAVGFGDVETPEGNEGHPLIQHWDGSKWTSDAIPLPDEAKMSSINGTPLSGVSCASKNACMAVGYYHKEGEPWTPLNYRWDGVEWSLVEMPAPPESAGARPTAVDCPSPSWCMAVGNYSISGAVAEPFAEVWDGKEWTLVQYDPPGKTYTYLSDVSCAEPDDCVALIHFNGERSSSHVEHWDGEGWTEETLPEAPGAERTVMNGLSCPAVDACTAVGVAIDKDVWEPSAYAWDGSAWSVQSTSVQTLEGESGIPGAEFLDVSCASPSSCVADGGDRPEAGEPSGIAGIYRAPGPAAMTDPATAIGWTGATLNATVNPEGSETSYQFEYGTSKKYGSSAPASPAAIGSGSEDVAIDRTISGLQPATTYHFRVKATNAEGTTHGEDRRFRTPPIAPPHFRSSFGEAGSGQGQLDEPLGIALDSEGDSWVADSENSRVAKFAEDGELLAQVGSEGSAEEQFAQPYAVAVAPDGNVWVADTSNNRLVELGPEGEFLKTVGWGVADGESAKFQSCESGCHAGIAGTGAGQLHHPYGISFDPQGDMWVVNITGQRVEQFSAEGEYLSQFAVPGSNADIAIDAEGDVWLVDYENHIKEFSPEGELLLEFGTEGSGAGQFDFPTGISLDAGGNVWVADSENDRIQVFDPSGEYLTQFGAGGSEEGQFDFPRKVAFDSSGDIWVIDSYNSRVQEWTYTLVARTEAASAIKVAEATLNATIGRSGPGTKYRFEYDTAEYKAGEGPHGASAPVPAEAIGFGSEDVEVSEPVAGLAGGTAYHFRVVAVDAEETAYGEDRQFTTKGPQAITEDATDIGGEEATLRASVNPRGLETEYHFEYTDQADFAENGYQNATSAPVPPQGIGSGAEAVAVEEEIAGLVHETSYRFRIVATNADGTAYGEDATFETTRAAWQQPFFDAESHPVLLAGAQAEADPLKLATAPGALSCEEAELEGEASAPGPSLDLAAELTGCSTTSHSATVAMNSCHFELGLLNAGPPYEGTLGVGCAEEGDAITIKTYSGETLRCTITYNAQKGGEEGVSLANFGEGSERGIEASFDKAPLMAKYTGGVLKCGIGNGGEANAPLSGAIALQGADGEEAPVGVFIADGEEPVPASPQATTEEASEVTAQSAKLNATVDPNGSQTDYWFEHWREDWQSAEAPSRTNHVTNPSFEADLAGWSSLTLGGTLARTESQSHDGAASMSVSGKNTAQGARTSLLPVAPSTTYTASAWVKAPIGVSFYFDLLEETEAGGDLASTGTVEGSGEWTRLSATLAFGSEGEGARIRLRMANEGTIHVDAVLLEASEAPGSYFPRVPELESGQAVQHEDGSYEMATPSYAPADKEGDAGKGADPVEVSETIEGLAPETTYHFRVFAENAEGSAEGGDESFETTPYQPLGTFISGEESEEEAEQPRFDAESHPLLIAGAQTEEDPLKLATAAGTLSCEEVELEGEASAPGTSLDLAAALAGCLTTSYSATVAMNSCHFELGVLNAGPPYEGTLGVGCAEAGDSIVIKTYKGEELRCTITYAAQQGGGEGVSLANFGEGSERGIEASFDKAPLTAKYTGGVLKCGIGNGGEAKTSLSGGAEMYGFG